MEYRVGLGFDSHLLKAKKNNIIKIGGMPVQCDYSVVAHSDGDVVFHAISDALLGAAGFGDVGVYFADSDPKTKDMDSEKILLHTLKMIEKPKWQIVNIDINIVVEHIKIDPVRYLLVENLERILKIKNINIKAKHYEEPKKEISCQVIVMLQK
ncbi:2-C-methyl-D-erythritol 2,4-cyclodiphosphate synthase [[Mycoplasma] testudinis]|uniref:2-C-methyl-D-erythritol 2,4-cyclodiphosphate synthase n=1 Tax=[Mycoplasma] testudinis TaxID=33924 RepID=UPI000485B1AB|nr:2-C-methyl-D-erythritol 2,4-cyclodiphosphate synthase [[Mycoplasma] testudinis]